MMRLRLRCVRCWHRPSHAVIAALAVLSVATLAWGPLHYPRARGIPPVAPSWAGRAVDALTVDRRPSPPLITGDGFRAYADHVCDEAGCALAAPGFSASLKRGDLVFVKVDFLAHYLERIAPRIPPSRAHVVVAHNGDEMFTADMAAMLYRSPSIAALFVQSIESGVQVWGGNSATALHGDCRTAHPDARLDCSAPRLHSLPIGLENRAYSLGRHPELYRSLMTRAQDRFAAHFAGALALLDAVSAMVVDSGCARAAPPLLACIVDRASDAQMSGVSEALLAVVASPDTACAAAPCLRPRAFAMAAFSAATHSFHRNAAVCSLASLPWVTLNAKLDPESSTFSVGRGFVGVSGTGGVLETLVAALPVKKGTAGSEAPHKDGIRYANGLTAQQVAAVAVRALLWAGSGSLSADVWRRNGTSRIVSEPLSPQVAALVLHSMLREGASLPRVATASLRPGAEGVAPAVLAAAQAAGLPRGHAQVLDHFVEAMAEHVFVVSPPGNGPQAHRTWESLAAGSVPVLVASGTGMDALTAGLPSVVLPADATFLAAADDWKRQARGGKQRPPGNAVARGAEYTPGCSETAAAAGAARLQSPWSGPAGFGSLGAALGIYLRLSVAFLATSLPRDWAPPGCASGGLLPGNDGQRLAGCAGVGHALFDPTAVSDPPHHESPRGGDGSGGMGSGEEDTWRLVLQVYEWERRGLGWWLSRIDAARP